MYRSPPVRRSLGALCLSALAALAACTPSLDWRESRPEDSGAQMMFPCKPRSHAREVPLAGQPVRMLMHACSARGMTFALTFAELGDPARVTPALRELREASLANLGGGETAAAPLRIEGMTPNPEAALVAVRGRRPDGGALTQQAAFFARGTRIYQASIVGTSVDAEAADTFFAGIRLP